jgi:flagellar biosynthesis protein FlhF
MRDALNIVKVTMGPEAVILHTRQIPGKRLLPWQTAADEVEITAGLGINVPTYSDAYRTGLTSKPKAKKVMDAKTTPRELAAHLALPSDPGVTLELGSTNRLETSPHPSRNDLNQPSVAELARQIDSIQQMLQQLGLKTESPPAPQSAAEEELPESLAIIRQTLLEKEVPEDIAEALVLQLKAECTPRQLADSTATHAMLTGLIERKICTRGPIQIRRGERKVVALVGATGVGKTTTIAKLAANFRLRDQVKMGLVTVDTYRIAAVEQLRTYAEIIDLPMKVVTNPIEMRRALDDLIGLDLVLIDTAGRSPRDELQIQELKRLLQEARVDEVHLVLSLTSSLRSLLASAEKFASANASSLILTKLDEAAGLGNLLALSRDVSLPISYLTTGQDVPNDIEPARANRIARLILGSDEMPK